MPRKRRGVDRGKSPLEAGGRAAASGRLDGNLQAFAGFAAGADAQASAPRRFLARNLWPEDGAHGSPKKDHRTSNALLICAHLEMERNHRFVLEGSSFGGPPILGGPGRFVGEYL